MGIRLLLVEDHRIVRQRLATLLQDQPGWQVVAEASDGREALHLAEACKPDVAVIGLAMPALNGIETTRRLVERMPEVRVIVLSTQSDPVYAEHARQAGAVGFVLTDAADVDLTAAVQAVSEGRTFTSPGVAEITPAGGSIRRGDVAV